MKKTPFGIFVQIVCIFFFCLTVGTSYAYTSYNYNDCIQGNGKVKSTDRDVPNFNIVDVSGAFEVNIIAGESKQRVKITADENLLAHIATSIQGNRLAIYPLKSICTENEIIIDISVKTLQGLVSSGSDNIKATGITSHNFSVVQGGSGDIDLEGHTRKFNAEISGAGDLNAQFLKAEKTSIHLTGSSNANVHATEELQVNITGVAEVNYFGNPKRVVKDVTGVGELNRMD